MFEKLFGKTSPFVPFDGPLRPNSALDSANQLLKSSTYGLSFHYSEANHLAYNQGNAVIVRTESQDEFKIEFDAEVTAIRWGEKTSMIVATTEALILGTIDEHGRKFSHQASKTIPPELAVSSFSNVDETWFAIVDNKIYSWDSWTKVFFSSPNSGKIWSIKVEGDKLVESEICSGLGFPQGLCGDHDGNGTLVVSDTLAGALIKLIPSETSWTKKVVQNNLPGLPGRITIDVDSGGYLLAIPLLHHPFYDLLNKSSKFLGQIDRTIGNGNLFAPPLIENPEKVPFTFWGEIDEKRSFVRKAPYGLIVALNKEFEVTASWHSSRNGTHQCISEIQLTKNNQIIAYAIASRTLIEIAKSNLGV